MPGAYRGLVYSPHSKGATLDHCLTSIKQFWQFYFEFFLTTGFWAHTPILVSDRKIHERNLLITVRAAMLDIRLGDYYLMFAFSKRVGWKRSVLSLCSLWINVFTGEGDRLLVFKQPVRKSYKCYIRTLPLNACYKWLKYHVTAPYRTET